MTGAATGTVLTLLEHVGQVCEEYHNEHVQNLRVRRLQCDEIWSFVGRKRGTVTPKAIGLGDVWTWVAIDADTKLVVSYLLGGRDAGWAMEFMEDCASRISGPVQVTTDGHKAYLQSVEYAIGVGLDYAILQKVYGSPSEEEQRRYSPGRCIRSDMKVACGDPDPKHVSTSFVERQNLTMRMGIRRFTRLTNAFSKKIENHAYAVAVHFMHYNFVRVHQTLRVTPAMEAGLTNHPWTIEELVSLVENSN